MAYQKNEKMKRIIISFICVTLSALTFGQTDVNEKYEQVEKLLKADDTKGAYSLLKEIKLHLETEDSLYQYVVWYYVATASELESEYRRKEDYSNSLKYGLEALQAIQENKEYFDEKFAEREPWMNKNIIVSYFGLGQIENAKKYKEKLYQGFKDKKLPEGIDGYFNFDFFKLKDKNIWGYEWYPELPDDRFSGSFTKVVYYVYSTNEDGTDKDQLFRFHVLMFHQDSKNSKFDYLLERQIETDIAIVSGSYYQYTYKKDIDYKKLKEDIKEIVTQEIEPSTRRTIHKRK
jgi:hypothetical protein